MEEFKINKYITLKLENGETNIYVYNREKEEYELFDQCIYILFRKKVYELEDFLENIESVDDLAEHLDHSLEEYEPEEIDITPETQFWVHCSNMQVWAENNYDTRLLHSNLAFPLLKRLTKLGDLNAHSVFRKEILDRFKLGSYQTQMYLMVEGFLNYFTLDEIVKNTINTEESIRMQEIINISNKIGIKYELVCSFTRDDLYNKNINENRFSIEGGYLCEFEITVFEDSDLNYYINKFKKLINLRINLIRSKRSEVSIKLKHNNVKYLTVIFYNSFSVEDIILETPKLAHLELINRSKNVYLKSFSSLTSSSLNALTGLKISGFNLDEKIKCYLDTLKVKRGHFYELNRCKIYRNNLQSP